MALPAQFRANQSIFGLIWASLVWSALLVSVINNVGVVAKTFDPVAVCPGHINVDSALRTGRYDFPEGHPVTQSLLARAMPRDHPNIDNLMRRGRGYGNEANEHPNVNGYLSYRDCPCRATLFSNHPNIDSAIANGTVFPADHPIVQSKIGLIFLYAIANGTVFPADHPIVQTSLAPSLPAGHPNCDKALRERTPLPEGHPAIMPHTCYYSLPSSARCQLSVPADHPHIDQAIQDKVALPSDHPALQFVALPAGHPDPAVLLHQGTSLPEGHPALEGEICCRNWTNSPGEILAVLVIACLSLAFLCRQCRIWRRASPEKGQVQVHGEP
eukprot:g44263.t1